MRAFQLKTRIQNSRKGGMLVLVAVVMVIFMVAAAFCVDIAYMHMVKSELRTAVDAASRAGTETLARTQDPDSAVQSAVTIAAANNVAGEGLKLNLNEVLVGSAELQTNGRFAFQQGGNQLNSVSVVGRRDENGPDGADGTVGLFFGNVFGVDSFQPVLGAISASSVRDIALVLDRSGSMRGSRLRALVNAVNGFLDEITDSSPNSTVSLTTYASGSSRDLALTENFGTVRNRVNRLRARGATNIFQGLQQGSDSLEQDANRRRFAEKTVIVMTDGNFNVGGTPVPSARIAAGRNQTIHTITFSGGANQGVMKTVANIGGGIHIHADDAGDLNEAFREIARTLSVLTVE